MASDAAKVAGLRAQLQPVWSEGGGGASAAVLGHRAAGGGQAAPQAGAQQSRQGDHSSLLCGLSSAAEQHSPNAFNPEPQVREETGQAAPVVEPAAQVVEPVPLLVVYE